MTSIIHVNLAQQSYKIVSAAGCLDTLGALIASTCTQSHYGRTQFPTGSGSRSWLGPTQGTCRCSECWQFRHHSTIDAGNSSLLNSVTQYQVESNIVRCPDSECAEKMIELIEQVRRSGNSIGGLVECVARNVPRGLGSPVFDKLEADIAKGVMSLPATKGFEIGSGFAGTELTGSEHNDEFFINQNGEIRTITNRSGGIQGGISNGENIILRVAFKPTATIRKEQRTVNREGQQTVLAAKGRHDPCVLPRAVPMVETMVALVLCDHLLRHQGQCSVL